MQDVLDSAIAMHQAGQLGDAALLYQKVLAQDEANASALHLFGVLYHQQGDDVRAVALIGRALAVRPSMPAAHANLAEAYRGLGQLERAVGCCRLALKLWPECPEALCNLGLALQVLGRREEAAQQFRRALEIRPDIAPFHNNLGIVLRELGQLDEALEHFRRAVGLAPSFAPALTNLGQMLLDRGNAAEALPYCQEAVRLEPDVPAVHHNLGNALGALERWVDARAAYLEALRLDPDLAPAHARLGLTLQREGQLGDALPWLMQAVELDPNNAGFQKALGDLYMEWGEPAEALPILRRALDLSLDDRAGLHLSVGGALLQEGRTEEAGDQFRIALRLQPDSAAVHQHLGALHEVQGELAEAEGAFRTALRLQPRFPLAHARLAILLRGRLPDEDLAALEEWLADPQLRKEPRARLLFGLAHVLDARGDYTRAAECLCEANALAAGKARSRWECVTADHVLFVDGLVEAFARDFFTTVAGSGLDTQRPVFVFGLPRSGTTLIEQVLASHSCVHGAGERRLAQQSFLAVPSIVGRAEPPLKSIRHLNAATIRRLAEQHLDCLSALAGGAAKRVVDKMPDNYMHLGFLATLFPKATFIHCRRDLRDVAVSCWMTDFGMIGWANDPEQIATRFRQYRRLMDHWRAVLPVPMHEVDYEETVADLEGVARRLVAACGLDWEPACLEFYRTRRPIRTASVVQVRQPIYSGSVARWKNYKTVLADLFAKLPSDPEQIALHHDGDRQVDHSVEAFASSFRAPRPDLESERI
ncbi:MAG: tetratricopeptide repeat protein [Isosphaerales bacterium]